MIDQNCLHDIPETMENCNLLLSDHSTLTREMWLPAIKAEVSPFICVIVQRKENRIDHKNDAAKSPDQRESSLAMVPYLSRTDMLEAVPRDNRESNTKYQLVPARPNRHLGLALPPPDLESGSSESDDIQNPAEIEFETSSIIGNVNGEMSRRKKVMRLPWKDPPTCIPNVELNDEEIEENFPSEIVPYDNTQGKFQHSGIGKANSTLPLIESQTGDKSMIVIRKKRDSSLQGEFYDGYLNNSRRGVVF